MNRDERTCDANMFSEVRALAANLHSLHQRLVADLGPQVRVLIEQDSRDEALIEHVLDRLLDSACIPEGLSLFKALCRYYWGINPRAAAFYVDAYRQIWDAESLPAELANETLPGDEE